MADDSIAAALRAYFFDCVLLGNDPIGVDWLPESGTAFSIDATPATQILQRYASGSTLRQYLFVVRSVHEYGPDAIANLSVNALYEQLADWMERQTKLRRFPDLGETREARLIEAQSSGYLFSAEANTARWQIQCRLVYFQKGERR